MNRDRKPRAHPPWRLLVWDIDGAVVDSYRAIRVAVDAALDAHGVRPAERSGTTEVVLRSLVGLSLDRLFGRLVAHRGPDPVLIDSLVDAYRDAFRSAGPQYARLVPGIAPLLTELRSRGVVSVVASSERSGVELLLEELGIADDFARLVSDDDVERHQRKPHPQMVSLVRRFYGYGAEDTAVIGASVFDVEMGQAAGVATVGVTWGNHSRGDLLERRPTHLVDDVRALGRLLGGPRSGGGPTGGDAGLFADTPDVAVGRELSATSAWPGRAAP